jgi:hypothetical protein
VTRVQRDSSSTVARTLPDGTRVSMVGLSYAGQVQNIGLGPAINVQFRMDYQGSETDIELYNTYPSPPVIPVLEPNSQPIGVTFLFLRPEGAWVPDQIPDSDFRLTVTFQDRRMRPAGQALNLGPESPPQAAQP